MIQPPLALLRTIFVALCAAVLAFAPAQAQPSITMTTTISWTEEEVVLDGDSPSVDDYVADANIDLAGARRYAGAHWQDAQDDSLAHFGPFAVIDAQTARMAGDVTAATPRQFAAMLAAHPTLKRLEMVDCPGSLDEEANLILARALRRAGLETIVPAGGSIRSGAVELWLAGVRRSAAPDAEFGVHSWADEYGREAKDYPANDPVHAEYLDYYREMGLDAARAREFYTLTNNTPFDQVRYLSREDMARFVALN